MYIAYPGKLSDLVCLSTLKDLVTNESIDYFVETGTHIDRASMDGLVTLYAHVENQKVGIVWTDFRVSGGSIGIENSKRLSAFIKTLSAKRLPLVFFVNSLGVRFMEGRTVFNDAFGVIADLYQFRKNNLFIGLSIGKTLGLSALFFAQAHYRFALEDHTQINLTGPEVHRKFFGGEGEAFESYTPADYQFDKNSLIHEISGSLPELCASTRNLISISYGDRITQKKSTFSHSENEQGSLLLGEKYNEGLEDLKTQLGDELLELFPQKSPVVRCYIGRFNSNARVGYFVNPPGHPNNLLSVNAIEKSLSALALFRALKLPVVSIIDCPGGDPRKKESDKDALIKMIQLSHEMIDYPHPKMGIVFGRCFGGSGMFGFPKIFGGRRVVAVQGSLIGVMHKSIISQLLTGSAKLHKAWTDKTKSETPDLADLIRVGTLDEIIEKKDILKEITQFLEDGTGEVFETDSTPRNIAVV